MKVDTTRFGKLDVDKNDIIHLEDGLLGFENVTRFFIVDPSDQTLILWFQSVDDGSIAFPIIEPKIFKPDYVAKLLPVELISLELDGLANASVYTILTIPKVVTEMSANLKAPIVINNVTKKARQIVLQDNKLEVKFPMYKDLKKYLMSFSSDDSRRTKVEENNSTTTQPLKKEEKVVRREPSLQL